MALHRSLSVVLPDVTTCRCGFLLAWVVAAPGLLESVAAAAPARDDAFADARATIEKLLVEEALPSVAVAVARDGKIVWEEGFGWANRERRIPATAHTLYSLASISKPITATGLMVLVERGKIDLDKPINEYLGSGGLTGRAGDATLATVRRVANHTSGLPLHYQFFYQDEPHRPPSRDETIRRYGNLVTAPGERYQYSNLGYGVLDYVIARVSGQSYAEFMRREVFLPLGLTHCSVAVGPGLEDQAAERYGSDGSPIPFYGFDHDGGSAVYCSAHDLVRFGMFHLGNDLSDQRPILDDEALRAMQQPTAESGTDSGYGIGWGSRQGANGARLVSHSGGMGGVSTTLTLVPEKNIAVAVLLNARGPVNKVLDAVLAGVLPGTFGDRDSAATPPATPDGGTFDPGDDLRGTWRGSVHTYEGELALELFVQDTGDVHLRLGEQLPTLLDSPSFRDGFLRGRFNGDIGTGDANRTRYHLALEVKLRGEVLNGSLIAMSEHTPQKTRNALAHWIELRRQPEAAP